MPTTTPNFGWSVPVSTDLVKDGATAIELLGDSIDAALVDLKGGTTGQVLAKASGTDLDFTFVTVDDTNAIQSAIVDAKGDLIGATAADTPARLAVGANNTVLTADSSEATGLKWATPASGSGPTFAARASSTQTLVAFTNTKIAANTELWDSDSCYDTTLFRFTPTKAGYYDVNLTQMMTGTPVRTLSFIFKNGANYLRTADTTNSGADGGVAGSGLVDLNGTTDYIEFFVLSTGTPTTVATAIESRFSAIFIRGL